jgi:LEA14-like dessication related protein
MKISGWSILPEKEMAFRKIYFAVAVIALLTSCRAMKEPDFKGIDSFKIMEVKGDTSTLAVNVTYYNPNKRNLKLKDAVGDAYIDSIYLGHFSMDTMIRIAKLSDFTIPVILKANMKNVYQNAISVFMNKEFNIRLEGQCKVGKGGLFFPYPIHYQGKQALKLF